MLWGLYPPHSSSYILCQWVCQTSCIASWFDTEFSSNGSWWNDWTKRFQNCTQRPRQRQAHTARPIFPVLCQQRSDCTNTHPGGEGNMLWLVCSLSVTLISVEFFVVVLLHINLEADIRIFYLKFDLNRKACNHGTLFWCGNYLTFFGFQFSEQCTAATHTQAACLAHSLVHWIIHVACCLQSSLPSLWSQPKKVWFSLMVHG